MSKDLVEQLRVIHLTVLLMCLIPVASAFSQQRGPLKRAYDDAVYILTLAENRDHFQSVAQNEITSRFSDLNRNAPQSQEFSVSPFISVTYAGKVPYKLDRRSPYFLAEQKPDHYDNIRINDYLKYLVTWDSLNEFINVWEDPILILENPLRREQFSSPVTAHSDCGISLQLIPSETASPDEIGSVPQMPLDPIKQAPRLSLPVFSIDPNARPLSKGNCQASVPLGH